MWPQIHRIDLYPAHKAIIFPNTYQLDFIQWTALSNVLNN